MLDSCLISVDHHHILCFKKSDMSVHRLIHHSHCFTDPYNLIDYFYFVLANNLKVFE